jgi:hypothetical protein
MSNEPFKVPGPDGKISTTYGVYLSKAVLLVFIASLVAVLKWNTYEGMLF